MGNNSKIEWCDASIQPLGFGCYGPGGTAENPKICSYCYAARMAKRNLVKCRDCRNFIPHWHQDQCVKPLFWKTPRKIFVQSMGDLFGDWVRDRNILDMLILCKRCPQHTFIFLTKNPKRLADYDFPNNAWVGVTATDQLMAETAVKELAKVEAKVKFLSCEPLLGRIDMDLSGIDWVIIGAQTGPGAVIPKLGWVDSILTSADSVNVPVFIKSNLVWAGITTIFKAKDFGVMQRQEWPRGSR